MGLEADLKAEIVREKNAGFVEGWVTVALTAADHDEAALENARDGDAFIRWVEEAARGACVAAGVNGNGVTATQDEVTVGFNDRQDVHAGEIASDR